MITALILSTFLSASPIIMVTTRTDTPVVESYSARGNDYVITIDLPSAKNYSLGFDCGSSYVSPETVVKGPGTFDFIFKGDGKSSMFCVLMSWSVNK